MYVSPRYAVGVNFRDEQEMMCVIALRTGKKLRRPEIIYTD